MRVSPPVKDLIRLPEPHRKSSPRVVAHAAVSRIEGENAYTDIVLSHVLERYPLPERDRGFVTELVRGTIRWKKKLDWIVDQLFSGKKEHMPAAVRRLLWQALYQIDFMKVPAFAAVNETINIARSQKQHRWVGVMNAILRSFVRHPQAVKFPDAEREPVLFLSVTESFPEWIVERWIHLFGLEKTRALCRANNIPPVLSVRVNQQKISLAAFAELLERNGVLFRPSLVNGFFRIESISYDIRMRLLEDGFMTVQDESAGLPSLLAQPKTGQTVVDLCAAPGGKSTHLAELMHNQGCVISSDVNRNRVRLLHKSAQRLELTSLFPVVADARCVPLRRADIVLLDAPCSGLGVLRRKPDLRWQKGQQDFLELQHLQRDLIESAGKLVGVDGMLVYSTCTVEPEENEQIVEAFLCNNPDFEIVNARTLNIPSPFVTQPGFVRTWPHEHDMDGSFAAKMIKRK